MSLNQWSAPRTAETGTGITRAGALRRAITREAVRDPSTALAVARFAQDDKRAARVFEAKLPEGEN